MNKAHSEQFPNHTGNGHEVSKPTTWRERLKSVGVKVGRIALVGVALVGLGRLAEEVSHGKPIAKGVQTVSADSMAEASRFVEGSDDLPNDFLRGNGLIIETSDSGAFIVPKSVETQKDFNPANNEAEWAESPLSEDNSPE